MTDGSVMIFDTPEPLNDAQWEVVLKALPDAVTLKDRADLRERIGVVTVENGSTLPANGAYVVLAGKVELVQTLKGKAALAKKEDVLATAAAGNYFYEEHLVFNDLPVSLTARAVDDVTLAYLSRNAWYDLSEETRQAFYVTLFGDLVEVNTTHFQQSINCCSVTAAALSMTALGFACEVNDIFHKVNLPSSYVIHSGIALGELYDIACNYIHKVGLRDKVRVTPYFMDPEATNEKMLLDGIMESERVGGTNDILVANFQVGIAHGNDLPGGHFAVIAKCNPSTGLLHMMDVHPEKYGKMWVTTVSRLYEAMSDRDSGSLRARGLMRFSAREAVKAELETLNTVCRYVDSTIHLDISSEKRHELFRRATPNMNGLSVLAESFEIFGDHMASEDKLLQATDVSYTESLSTVRTAQDLSRIAQQYLAANGELHVDAEFRSYTGRPAGARATPEGWFKSQLQSLNEHKKRHLMINIDVNKVMGHQAVALPDSAYVETALLEEFWCLCIAYDTSNDYVTLVDMSPATSQVWQAKSADLFGGLREKDDVAMIVLEERELPLDPGDVARLVKENTLALFYAEDDASSYMLRTVLKNIGVTEVYEHDVSGHDPLSARMRRVLDATTGQSEVPYLFLEGEFLGHRKEIIKSILDGLLQERIAKAGLKVLDKIATPELDNNIFGYPKGGLVDPRNEKKNVLLCACGSSAADKVPELVKRLVDEGHNVKLVPSPHAEHFFKDLDERKDEVQDETYSYDVHDYIDAHDIYRDSDEWNFRYTQFGMSVRASHLALCDWADCVIVAPITCNTMAKVAHGVGDSLMTSIFVAWQYQTKPVILCPACNTNMWNNLTTQDNVAKLKRLGAAFAGPRWSVLSNGMRGIGAMATPDEIVASLNIAFDDLEHQTHRVFKWAQEASMSAEASLWDRVFRPIREDIIGVNVIDDETGDTLLHFAAGGPGETLGTGTTRGVPHLHAAKLLIKQGIDVNKKNRAGFTAMHVAMKNGAEDIIKLILDETDFNELDCMKLYSELAFSDDTTAALLEWYKTHSVDLPEDPDAPMEIDYDDNDTTYLYFTYGSLKRGFPNHEDNKDVLKDFVGVATTTQALPLIVQKEPKCDNEDCKYLHRMATLVDKQGEGRHVIGEVYRVTAQGLEKLDKLEGYDRNRPKSENKYVRRKTKVEVKGRTETVFCYFIQDPSEYQKSLENNQSEMLSEYTMDMAKGPLKEKYRQ